MLPDLVARFCQQAKLNASRVDCVEHRSMASSLLQEYFTQNALEPKLHLSPALSAEWLPEGINVSVGTTHGEHKVCVNEAWAGIADTGTLVVLSSPGSPTRLNFLSDVHVVFLQAADIVQDKSQFWKKMQDQSLTMPRAMNFISGPSRTGDIEQTIQLGAHGPRMLWVLVEGSFKPSAPETNAL